MHFCHQELMLIMLAFDPVLYTYLMAKLNAMLAPELV